MKIVKGIYAEAKIFTDDVETYAVAQVKMICDKVIPQLLGVDIGCGITCVKLNKNNAEFQKLDRVIRENIPSGSAIRKDSHHMAEAFSCEELHCMNHINVERAGKSLGTLGGGNHFIELDRGIDGSTYLTVHTGSRHLGEEVAEYYTKLANRLLKKQGKEIPYYMGYLEGENKEAYVEDVQVIQRYAEWNRQIIVREILKGMKWKAVEQFSVAHNYLDTERILRKGAISARNGEKIIMIIQISSGQGPPECQLAVAKLAEALKKEYGDLEIVSETKGYEKGCYDSIRFQTCRDLSSLEGTVLWICKSPYRQEHKRKNWYVDVSIILDLKVIATDQEYRIEKFHCGGKGGQNVNKVETGVRIIHIPTGLVSQSTEERSQFQNKQRAMEKLQEKLIGLQQEQQEKPANAAWQEHNRIVRGNPIRIYVGERFILKKSQVKIWQIKQHPLK